ncbi:MAG: ATP-grasp domain-containing protein [Magnetovibrio sp.]|nr:ATP-grasp domain-containing protein [Magnetovibrio sp.]
MNENNLSVALTGFGGLDNPEPGLAVARSLRAGWNDPLEIEALCYDTWNTGAWMPKIADRIHLVVPIAKGDDAVLARLKEIHAKHPFQALIPCLDLEVPAISRLSRRLDRMGVKTLLPAPEDAIAVSKANLPNFCYANGMRTPRTLHVRDLEDVPLYAERFGFPLFVKGTVAGAKKVNNATQAAYAAAELNAKWGGGVLLQEAIDGEEYVVGMVARADESCLALSPMRKLGVNKRGKGVVGAIIDNPALRKEALRILAKLHWRGPLELEFVQSERDGRFYLLEVNCRFPSWIFLTQFAGANLPGLFLNEVLGTNKRLQKKGKVGTAFVRDVQEVAISIKDHKDLKRFGTIKAPESQKRRAKKGPLTVAVTGVSAFELTQPGLGVAQALHYVPEVGQVFAFAYGAYDTGLQRHDIFDAGFQIPPDDESDAALLDRLEDIQKNNGLDIIIPNLDGEINRFQNIERDLKKLNIDLLIPSKKAFKAIRKDILFAPKSQQHWGGFELTPSKIVKSRKDVRAAWDQFGSPLMLKGQSFGATMAYSLRQAEDVWDLYQEDDQKLIIAQPVIYGEEFGMGVVCDRNHNVTESLTIKKLLMCEQGKTWGAVSMQLPELQKSLSAFLKHIGWVGPADAEFIRDAVSDQYYLIEINPRLPAWNGFGAMQGNDLTREIIKITSKSSIVSKSNNEEMLFLRAAEELPTYASSLALFANRGEKHNG